MATLLSIILPSKKQTVWNWLHENLLEKNNKTHITSVSSVRSHCDLEIWSRVTKLIKKCKPIESYSQSCKVWMISPKQYLRKKPTQFCCLETHQLSPLAYESCQVWKISPKQYLRKSQDSFIESETHQLLTAFKTCKGQDKTSGSSFSSYQGDQGQKFNGGYCHSKYESSPLFSLW